MKPLSINGELHMYDESIVNCPPMIAWGFVFNPYLQTGVLMGYAEDHLHSLPSDRCLAVARSSKSAGSPYLSR
jgi:hypothetical protein